MTGPQRLPTQSPATSSSTAGAGGVGAGGSGAGDADALAAPAPTGSIFDLGYRGYEGPRLGRRHAIYALFIYSLRSAYGIGRSGRAKVIPIGLAVLALLPAVVELAVRAFATQSGAGAEIERLDPIRYDSIYGYIPTLVMLFTAAQAPELLGRDQRYHVLSLYFSRALLRVDYVVAKIGAFVAAILIMILLPQAVIFLGRVFSSTDLIDALRQNLGSVPPVLGVGLAIALLLGSIGLAVSAFTSRRAYATAGIIAVFLVPSVVAQIVIHSTRSETARYVALISPGSVLDGVNAFVFGSMPQNSEVRTAGLEGWLYLAAAVVAIVVLLAIVARRYERIEA